MSISFWEYFYNNTPLGKIPWQKTQADWLKELIRRKIIQGKTALDLGCGTGQKTILLVKEGGFEKAVGIDISQKATSYARGNAVKAEVEKRVEFFTHDVTNLSFLGTEKFDFILDWALFHCLPPAEREKYITQIYLHSGEKATLLLRVFSKYKNSKKYFITHKKNKANKVYFFDRMTIKKHYSPFFNIKLTHRSRPRTHQDFYFDEYLMSKI